MAQLLKNYDAAIHFLQGPGAEGRFGGLSDAYSSFHASQICLLPVPFDRTTTYQKGTDLGPAALIDASRNLELYDIETDSEVFRRGIHTAPAILSPTSEKMLQATYEKTVHLLKEGKFVGVLGGEHSISFAPIRAHAERFGPLTVLQLDAHADLASHYEGNPWSHASVMARVKELPSVAKIVSVGIRSMSSEERAACDRENTFFAHDLDPFDKWIEEVVERLSERVYLSFDLDAFDSSLMPSTGTPEPGGLFWKSATALLRKVAQKKEIVGFDVVELCPLPVLKAPDFLAAKLVYKVLSYVFLKRGSA